MATETFEFDRAETVEDAVFQALGAASTCWENLEGTGVFQSDRARAIGERLVEFIGEKTISRQELQETVGDGSYPDA